jgi:hypothetical protein
VLESGIELIGDARDIVTDVYSRDLFLHNQPAGAEPVRELAALHNKERAWINSLPEIPEVRQGIRDGPP